MPNVPAPAYPATVVAAVTSRYSDAYVVARAIDALGLTVKGIGIFSGVILGLASFVIASKGGGTPIAFAGVIFALLVATAIYLLGVLASAQGQILKATLDTAVNSSHFLTDQDRAGIMSLPDASPFAAAVSPQVPWTCGCGQKNPAGAVACLDCGVRYGAA
jgi:hypothetical protein